MCSCGAESKGSAPLSIWGTTVSELESTAGLAAEVEDGQLTPPSEPTGATGRASYEDEVGRSLLEALGVTEDEPEEPAQPEPQLTAELEDEPAPAAEATPQQAAAPSPEEQMARWVDDLLENPAKITRIPQKFQAAALEARDARRDALTRAEIQRAQQAGEQAAMARIQAEQARQQAAAAVAEIDQLKREDPAGYVEWRDLYPDRAKAYDDFRDQQRNPQPPSVDLEQHDNQRAVSTAQAIIAKLSPSALSALRAKQAADPSLYMGAAGLPQLITDVAEIVAEERLKARQEKEAPARAALEQRQANTAERRATPRPDVSTGTRADDPLTDDVDALISRGLTDVFRNPTAAIR